jgi:hypothetical protein
MNEQIKVTQILADQAPPPGSSYDRCQCDGVEAISAKLKFF